MEQNKEQLEKLLQFIDKLGQNPDNAWFVARLKTKYAPKSQSEEINKNYMLKENDVNLLRERISNIEKYLGLDFGTDTANSIIDYNNIEDIEVRNQLVSDNREMLRYRHGTRSHKVDFNEFCKYAHFQAEMLFNFVYEPIGHYTIKDCMEHIRYFFPEVTFSEKVTSPADITYYAKMFAYTEEFFHIEGLSTKGTPKRSKIFWTLKNIETTRNETNHRGKNEKNTDIYESWLHSTPFDEVIDIIKILAQHIQGIDRTTFLEIPLKWFSATISKILPSAAFVKIENGKSMQLPSNFLKAVEGRHEGDSLEIKLDHNGCIVAIN